MLEAFIGALFIDSEFNYDIVQKFFDSHIRPYFVDMSLYDGTYFSLSLAQSSFDARDIDFAGQHPTTFLTKKLVAIGCDNWGWECEQYKTDEDNYVIAAIMIHGEVFTWGKAQSARMARVRGAEKALKDLREMGDEEAAKLCTCVKTKAV